MAFRWRADVGPTLNVLQFFRGSGPILLRNPIFCNFSGGGGPDPCPTLDPHMLALAREMIFCVLHVQLSHFSHNE